MARVYEIHLYETDDPVRVDNCTQDGVGVLFTVDGVTTFVPWIHVTKIVSYRRPEIVPVDDTPEIVGDETAGEDADDAGTDANDDTGDDGGSDPKSSDAKEWPKADNATMRAWAQSQGLGVSASGPVSKDVAAAYAAAHAE